MISDDDLLKILSQERQRSVGFDHDDELNTARTTAIEYSRGVMDDLPSLPNRSSVVSTDINDAIETILPDLVEIFIGGDDVVAFTPTGEEDEEGAQQETDYLNHVVFNENNGAMAIYDAFKDALLERTGIFTWWWEKPEEKVETFTGKTAVELELAAQKGEVFAVQVSDGDYEDGEPLYDFSLKTQGPGKACIACVAPSDFTIASEGVEIKTATYCATRERVRAQDLIARGYKRELVEGLPPYGAPTDEIDHARDTSDESDEAKGGGTGDLRTVEVVQHFVRLLEGGELKLFRVVTGKGEKVLLEKEEVEQIRAAALTPYRVPHRFYGRSVADLLTQIQKQRTALWRMLMDSGFFALNQRMEVAMSQSNEWTIGDLLRNEPMVPIRVATPGAVRPVSAGALNFDVLSALEATAVQGEQRTGIVRNAQGLNPDTLHDTADGMAKLFLAAQRRTRMIARLFAETGVKDLFLGVHAMLRKHAQAAAKVRLRGKWVEVDPTQWGERNDMTIEVGLGAAGREQDQVAANLILQAQERLVQAQGGMVGPYVKPENLNNALQLLVRSTGKKSPELYFSDPTEAEPQPPKPDPEAAKAEAQMQAKAAESQAKLQLQAQEGQAKLALQERQMQMQFELDRMKIEGDLQLQRETAAAELNMKRELLAAEIEAKREVAYLNAQVARETKLASVGASSDVQVGGEPG